jgi:hypothetical protein
MNVSLLLFCLALAPVGDLGPVPQGKPVPDQPRLAAG